MRKPPTGKIKASGVVNPVKVRCTKCGTEQFAKPRAGFTCIACGKRH